MLCALLVPALPARAAADTIDNTALVTYRHGGSTPITQRTNIASLAFAPGSVPATLRFLRHDPSASSSASASASAAVQPPIAIDGGQCRINGGSFAPLPVAIDSDGRPLAATVPVAPESRYAIGSAILVEVADANRNDDPAVREYVDVDLSASIGDQETLRLRETAADSGVFAAAIQGVAMPPPATERDCVLSLADGAQIVAHYVDTEAPADDLRATATAYAGTPTVIRMEQTASKSIVEVGDFLQYTMVVTNTGDIPANSIEIRDRLPQGLRYQAGTLRVGDPRRARQSAATGVGPMSREATPVVAPRAGPVVPMLEFGGLVMRFNVGDLDVGESIQATFVAEITSGTNGRQLVNYAIATASGAWSSNETDTLVRMRDSFNTTRVTLIGRVLESGSCDTPAAERKGVPNVRVLLEDGTYAATDANGAYHFEGVRPGTHVLQLDVATLPPDLELAACERNTRFAGRADSQFVEAQGGTLWRGDFHVRPKPPVSGSVGVHLTLAPGPSGIRNTVEVDGGAVPAGNLKVLAVLPEGATVVPGSTSVDGVAAPDPDIKGNFAVFRLGDAGVDWQRKVVFETTPGTCAGDGYDGSVSAIFDAVGESSRTPMAGARLRCDGLSPSSPPVTGERAQVELTAAAEWLAASSRPGAAESGAAIADDITAAGGGNVDWLRGQEAGHDWLFPGVDYNPRAPVTRVVVKHRQGERVSLRLNGAEVEQIRFDRLVAGAKGLAASVWGSIHLKDDDNLLEATITDAGGNVVARLSRVVHYAGNAASVAHVPERSVLVADGIHRPVIAVRLLDRFGKPVRRGAFGELSVLPPHEIARELEQERQQEMLGMRTRQARWHVRGDDGVALVELEPTGSAGLAKLHFTFRNGGEERVATQDISAWLKSSPRDWVVVGFAKGSLGYETLEDNMQALQPGEDGNGLRAEGQVAVYAKGRVLGKWLMTVAYDSDKPTDRLHDQALLSTIDPGRYYTLYGDGSHQGYDAASAEKLYLKLERDQFYALFGDFQSGLDRSQLSRYQRTLNGAKVEYQGPLVEFNGFAAETAQDYARDELQGDGTSGLYRLSGHHIVLNSERIRIETRERHHSERIIETRELVRHIDYDIDYDNGTLFFREPIASRDFDFNPVWIVAEYETSGGGKDYLHAGGRIGVRALDGRLEAGASYIHDEGPLADTDLAGVDVKFRPTPRDELRAEFATTRTETAGDADAGTTNANAWLLEWERRGEAFSMLAYARRQSSGFGLGQQNRYESGMFKSGVRGQYKLGRNFSLEADAYRQEDLDTGAVRDAARATGKYRGEGWEASAGLQWARDTAPGGRVAESRQATVGASKLFLAGKLELGAQADLSLGGKNQSVDFPTRLQLRAAYRVNDAFRILAAKEFTDGQDRDTSTTRFGFEATPWKDATLTTTLNQSQVSEYGPRTFALFGLNQKFRLDEHWSMDAAVDSSRAFNESGRAPLVVDPSQPIQAGGIRDGGALTDDFVAVSSGATYHSDLWMWNARIEARQSDSTDRYGFSSAFLRQVRDGIAFSASTQAFWQENNDGSKGLLANAQLSLAYRPLGGRWSMLDKLEFRLDELRDTGDGSVPGQGDRRSARIVNNFVLNYASDAWTGDGARGSVLDLYQRSQLSLYYGSKYVIDSFDSNDYAGYTDLIGAEYRLDLTPRVDLGLRASLLHSWSQGTYAWAFGPSVGVTPFTNAWVSIGYNIRGFDDRDFGSSHYTADGAYLVFRMKFDQRSLGLDRAAAADAR